MPASAVPTQYAAETPYWSTISDAIGEGELIVHHVAGVDRIALLVEMARQGRKPMKDPPSRAQLHATFYVKQKRDEDNLTASLKWLLDAVKQRAWRSEGADHW